MNERVLSHPTAPTPSRRGRVEPFLAMDVLAEAGALERAGRRIAHMEVGQPGAPAPASAISAVRTALAAGRIGYTEALGLPSLRARIARFYHERYHVAVDPGRVAVTTGSSGGFTLAFLSMFDVGARVAISAPGYPAYRNVLSALGLEAVEIETGPGDGWSLTTASVLSAHREKPLAGVLAMSPANPTGVMMDAGTLAGLARACADADIWFISDEIYHGLTYERPAETALRFSDDAVIVNSFSKYFCMTGWRIGWLVLPERLVRPVECLTQSLTISAPYLSQIAAEAAMDATVELEAVRAGYAANRALLMQALPAMGLDAFPPIDGAFYVYVDIGDLTNDAAGFCSRMLREAGVAATPGLDFDRARGNRFMRLSFAGEQSEIAEAMERMRGWLGR